MQVSVHREAVVQQELLMSRLLWKKRNVATYQWLHGCTRLGQHPLVVATLVVVAVVAPAVGVIQQRQSPVGSEVQVLRPRSHRETLVLYHQESPRMAWTALIGEPLLVAAAVVAAAVVRVGYLMELPPEQPGPGVLVLAPELAFRGYSAAGSRS